MGLSFAIPMDVVMNVVEQIKSHGKVERGWLGVQIQDVTRELAESFAMKRPYGALVAKVIAGSPAEKGGLKIGDIIVEFNGQKIESSAQLPPIVGMTPINKKSSVEIIRQGSNKTIFVTIGLLKEHEELQIAPDKSPGKPVNRIGLSVSDLNTEQREQFQVAKGGALVLQVQKGAAQDAGILQGDVILRVQNSVINNAADLEKVIDKLPEGKSIAVLVQRHGSPMFLAIKLKNP